VNFLTNEEITQVKLAMFEREGQLLSLIEAYRDDLAFANELRIDLVNVQNVIHRLYDQELEVAI
jgi:translation initiation factor IF-3